MLVHLQLLLVPTGSNDSLPPLPDLLPPKGAKLDSLLIENALVPLAPALMKAELEVVGAEKEGALLDLPPLPGPPNLLIEEVVEEDMTFRGDFLTLPIKLELVPNPTLFRLLKEEGVGGAM